MGLACFSYFLHLFLQFPFFFSFMYFVNSNTLQRFHNVDKSGVKFPLICLSSKQDYFPSLSFSPFLFPFPFTSLLFAPQHSTVATKYMRYIVKSCRIWINSVAFLFVCFLLKPTMFLHKVILRTIYDHFLLTDDQC